jgi:hypothetical protein
MMKKAKLKSPTKKRPALPQGYIVSLKRQPKRRFATKEDDLARRIDGRRHLWPDYRD